MKATNWALAALIGFRRPWGSFDRRLDLGNAWYCQARGTTGAWGWGRSWYIGQAKGVALSQCSVRTPRYARCYITFCR